MYWANLAVLLICSLLLLKLLILVFLIFFRKIDCLGKGTENMTKGKKAGKTSKEVLKPVDDRLVPISSHIV